jgi:pimeloyl-ACP methyl ester carboxylesterase
MMQLKTFAYQSAEIFYRLTGTGQPVVLIHGFGEDGTVWHNQIAELEKKHSLIIPDLPGSGNSSLIPDMSIEGMAECIKALTLFELPQFPLQGTEGVAFLGHSMGGYITLALTEKYPQLVKAFGLVHSSAYADSEEKKEARRKSIEFIQTHGAYDFLKTAIPGLFYQPENNKACEDLVEAGKKFTPEALVAYYTAMINRPDRTAILKNCTQPVLFIMGEFDKAVPFEHSLAQSHLPTQSHITILRNSAHMGMWEEKEVTGRAITGFLAATM